jgi:hypothetical protein
MALLDEANMARIRGDLAASAKYRFEAFETEREAASQVVERTDLETTRSILLKGAAVLALECGEGRAAEKLIAQALAGDPPPGVAEELRDLSEQVNFGRHLALNGLELLPHEIQVTLAGPAVSYGFASKEDLFDRLDLTEKMLIRTAERLRGLAFRVSGAPIKAIQDAFRFYFSTPRPASFAITMRIASRQGQLALPTLSDAGAVVDDVLDCLELYDHDQEQSLRARIGSDEYFENFQALARQLSPDGNSISQVGFTAIRQGSERQVALVRRKSALPVLTEGPRPARTKKGTIRVFEGAMKTAESRRLKKQVIIVGVEGEHSLVVPDTMMADVVRPYYEENVRVTATKSGRDWVLQAIDRLKAGISGTERLLSSG